MPLRSFSFVANCSILFTELAVQQRPAAAARHGFTEIEFWWPFADATPSAANIDDFVAAVESAGVSVTGLNYFAGDMAAGERGIIADPARVEEFRSGVRAAHELGRRLGCRSFNALYGIRGRAEAQQEEATAQANLRYAATAAAEFGAVVLLEPLSATPGYPLRSVEDVRQVLQQADAPDNLGLLADWYHLAANGADLAETIPQARDITRHVQIADCPGRGEPGSGALDFGRLFAILDETEYTGRVGLEYVPTTTTEESTSAFKTLLGSRA